MVSLTHDTMNYRPGPCPGAHQQQQPMITSYTTPGHHTLPTPGHWQ